MPRGRPPKLQVLSRNTRSSGTIEGNLGDGDGCSRTPGSRVSTGVVDLSAPSSGVRVTSQVNYVPVISSHVFSSSKPQSDRVKDVSGPTKKPYVQALKSSNKAALSKVASFVGKPICADEPTTTKIKIAFARVLVEVDLSKELPRGMTLQTPYRGTVLQKIEYEWLPHFCHSCRNIGHTQDRCHKNKPKKVFQPKPKDVVVATKSQDSPAKKDAEGFEVVQTKKKSTELLTDSVTTKLDNQFSVLAPTHSEVEQEKVHVGSECGQEVLEFLKRNKVDCGALIETHVKFATVRAIYHRTFAKYSMVSNYSSHPGGKLWVLWDPSWGSERLDLWNSLRRLSSAQSLPWLCLGDFNVSLSEDERVGCATSERDMQEFRDCLTYCSLVDHPYTGGLYTWHNKQVASPRWAKLDRLLANPAWFIQVPTSNVVVLHAGVSDHTPIVLTVASNVPQHKSFRYLNCWALSPNFSSVGTCCKRGAYCFSKGAPCPLLWTKDLLSKEHSTLGVYLNLKKAELRVLAQRAKVAHLQQTDDNTHYFYGSIAARRTRNTVGAIEDIHGTHCAGHSQVSQAFLTYYRLCWVLLRRSPLFLLLFFSHHTLTSTSLDAMVTVKEIEEAFFSIDRNKSPGVDGYTSGFFKDTWVSKILANRMKAVLDDIVGLEQAAFIQGRDLFDNSMLAHELAFKYNRSLLSPRCILKVDIKKAFDSVNWSFLGKCLTMYGFPPRLTRLVMACVTTSYFSLNINGSVEGYFPGKRGLRQGDPLSPYLFALCMEVLSRLLRKLPTHPGFSYHPKCVKINLTHLIFADDLLVFTRGDLPSIQAVDRCLKQFAAYSGLQVNPMKSNLYFGGVPVSVKNLILASTGYVEGDLPVRYLGIPLFSSRLTHKMFSPLLEKIRDKLSC
ncbi:uncharacterized protein LOC141639656 [Silene latifolia]|uniref:uncharacterized protein LOC141639656 n=1 Tax=Silene latifolia TaxID=37657 RepID=UPI003D779F7C